MIWHLLSGEYPPQPGGVSDHTRTIAEGLAARGDEVHVWCPPANGADPVSSTVNVHRELGRFTRADLTSVGDRLDRFPGPRRLLVQWVPHSYGYGSLNVGFCLWLLRRSRAGDRVEIVVHEPSLGFRRGAVRHNLAALIHRCMIAVLMRAADQVWVAAPAWEGRWRPFGLGRQVPFTWLPISSSVTPAVDPRLREALRKSLAPDGGPLVGHFGTYGTGVAELLEAWTLAILEAAPACRILMLGRGGREFAGRLELRHPGIAKGIHATGELDAESLSSHLAACDLLVQPFREGVNARRSSLLTGLAHELAIVTTTGPATEPFWREAGAVALVSEDADAAANAVTVLLGNTSARSQLSARAGATYRRYFEPGIGVDLLRRSQGECESRF